MCTQNLITRFFGMNGIGPDPFGAPLVVVGEEAEGSPFGFSTKYSDGETALVYFGYRYYTPQLGRWLSKDPIMEWGGWNVYGFLGNSAVAAGDVRGLFPRDWDERHFWEQRRLADEAYRREMDARHGTRFQHLSCVLTYLRGFGGDLLRDERAKLPRNGDEEEDRRSWEDVTEPAIDYFLTRYATAGDWYLAYYLDGASGWNPKVDPFNGIDKPIITIERLYTRQHLEVLAVLLEESEHDFHLGHHGFLGLGRNWQADLRAGLAHAIYAAKGRRLDPPKCCISASQAKLATTLWEWIVCTCGGT